MDSTIPQDHRARLVRRAVESLDLSGFYERIKARVDTAGRPPGDPKVFVALWLYATMDGVGAAREVDPRGSPFALRPPPVLPPMRRTE